MDKKKIGILTYHCVPNFGAQLQTFSTVSYLRNRGYTPVVINWYPEDLEQMYQKKITSKQQLEEHASFVEKYLPVTKRCRTEKEIISIIHDEYIDGLIFGSDAILGYETFLSRINIGKRGIQLWKSLSDRIFPNPFWACFAAKLNRRIPIAMMSVSSQNSLYYQINNPLRERMSEALLSFDYLSVRDDWTQKMVNYLTRGQILPEITPDPVFGFNHNAIDSIPTKEEILSKYGLPDKYILLSFINDPGKVSVFGHWVSHFEQMAQEAGFTTVALCMDGGISFKNNLKYEIDAPLAILDWYALIKYSQGYVGYRMHPVVVSLHNANPFFCFDNYGIVKYKYFVNYKSSKIYHIVNEAGLLKNRCTALGKSGFKEPSPEMVLDCILNFDREKCQAFSDKQLSKYLNMMNEIEKVFEKY